LRVLDRTTIDKEDLRHMSGAELAGLGIALLNKQDLVLQCTTCGQTWTPQLGADGKLPFHAWMCPRACNP